MKPLFQYLDWTCVYIEGGKAVHHVGGGTLCRVLLDGWVVGIQYVVYAETWWYTNGTKVIVVNMIE
jgi:hypothetical protein